MITKAVNRARYSIFAVVGTYAVSLLVGIAMVQAGSEFALHYRDQLVAQSVQHNPASLAYNQGDNIQAALWDFAGNLVMGAVPKTISGFAIILPFPLIVHQGWVGGIVSVRGDHTSRLNDPRSAVYYLLTLLLQLIPYSLAIGAGVNAGFALFRTPPYYQGQKWLGIFPKEALRDVARIYALAIPLFLVASLWEFLSTWNF
jgi:hypothetical protein